MYPVCCGIPHIQDSAGLEKIISYLIIICEGMETFHWVHFLGFIFLSYQVELITSALFDVIDLNTEEPVLLPGHVLDQGHRVS